MKNLLFFSMICNCLILISCRGENGTDGSPGADGNANVIISEWKISSVVKDSIIDGSKFKVGRVPAPEITAERLEDAAIFGYLDYGAGVFSLPFTSGKVSTINFFCQKHAFRPTRFTHDNSNSVSFNLSMKYRYIIIPKGTIHKHSLDFSDYSAVQKYFNLKN